MDDLAVHLARVARDLHLDGLSVQEAPDGRIREFAVAVLAELVARGLLDGVQEPGCWARPRSPLS